jgi:hypothetical protein
MLIFITSCRDCIEGSGNTITENRTVRDAPFDEVELNGIADVFISYDTIFEVLVEGEDNIIPYYTAKVLGGRLVIECTTTRCMRKADVVNVYVRMPELVQVLNNGDGYIESDAASLYGFEATSNGTGEINIRNIDTRLLNATVNGSGNMELMGDAESTNLTVNGSGQIIAYDLMQNECDAYMMADGNIYTRFYNRLNAFVSGSGNIFYKGDWRRVFTNITGSGSVIDDNK